MFEPFFREKLGPLVLRVAIGLVCIYHGFLKIMLSGGTAWQPGLPVFWQMVIAWGEFIAGVAIVLGFYCRLGAFVVMSITAGLFVWWHGWKIFRLPVQSLEPVVMFLLVTSALLLIGGGEFSLDARSGSGGSWRQAPRRRMAA
ncbi:MAG: GntR family transcriptional regulator [Gemmatales bacterium]|nr:MAG: GntR family transcriptional regulator [Gemmatales bacterium]